MQMFRCSSTSVNFVALPSLYVYLSLVVLIIFLSFYIDTCLHSRPCVLFQRLGGWGWGEAM